LRVTTLYAASAAATAKYYGRYLALAPGEVPGVWTGAGHGPTLLAGLRERIQLELVDRHEFRSGALALRYRPTRVPA